MRLGRTDLIRLLGAGVLVAGAVTNGEYLLMAAAAAEPPPTVRDEDGALAHRGSEVLVRGTARQAKIAAAVVTEALVVYCPGLGPWPEGVAGSAVLVRGRLERSEEFVADKAAGGAIVAATDGPVWVLRDCACAAR